MGYYSGSLIRSESDTIAAISTAMGDAGIGIVKLSGPDALKIASAVFVSPYGKDIQAMTSHTLTYGRIIHPFSGKMVDEVLISVMRGPRTYTTEDVVEINSHGGGASVKAVLDAVLCAGARMAEPGEFTKRAFLGGRIDLTQAEAVMDVIGAKSEKGLSMSLGQLRGRLKDKMDAVDQRLVGLLADIEANIDYPEYDVPEVSDQKIANELNEIVALLAELLKTLKTSRVLKNGVPTAIIGAPNVGKSSLLNELLQTDKAIVTAVPGTTRDIVEDDLIIDGVLFKLIDTAGIRETGDTVEQIGVSRSLEMIDSASLILFVIDGSRPTTDEEIEMFKGIDHHRMISILNKCDLPLDSAAYVSDHALHLSTKTGDGIETLQNQMVEMALGADIQTDESAVIANARQGACITEGKAHLETALEGLRAGLPAEMISIDIQNGLSAIRRVTGRDIGDDIVDEIFSRFCLGK